MKPRWILYALLLCLLVEDVVGDEALTVDVSTLDAEGLLKLQGELDDILTTTKSNTNHLASEVERMKLSLAGMDQEIAGSTKKGEALDRAKKDREEELKSTQRDVDVKRELVEKTSEHMKELSSQIKILEEKLAEMAADKANIEERYRHPSLADVIEPHVPEWGNVPRAVYSQTMQKVVPAVNEMSHAATEYRERVAKTSRFLALLTSLIIYGFVLGWIYLSTSLYANLRGRLTISRMIFYCDMFCACFWFLVLGCYAFLWTDPLHVLQHRTPIVFFVFQLAVFVCYAFYVFLRVVVLAVKMTPGSLGELLSVIVAGHHYYVRVWQPSITDSYFQGTLFYYFCYAWLFSAFAYNRVQEFRPVNKQRGLSIGFFTWMQALYVRFISKDDHLDPEDAYMYSDTDSEWSQSD